MYLHSWRSLLEPEGYFVDLLVSLLGELFQIFLSVRHIAQLPTHGKTVEILKSDLCKIIAGKT